MIRALTIIAAIAALAVSAAPALAATSKKPPHSTARVGGKMHLEDISLGATSPKPKPRGTQFFERSNAPFTVDM